MSLMLACGASAGGAVAQTAGGASATAEDNYRQKVKEIDLYQVPEGVHLLGRAELHRIILAQGNAVMIAQKERDTALEKYGLFFDKLLPAPKIDAATTETMNKTEVASSRGLTNSAGFGLGGSLPYGFDYSVDLPRVSRTIAVDDPAGAPASSTAAIGGTIGFNLLQGSMFFEGGISVDQAELDKRTAYLNYKTAISAALQAADTSFYDIIEQRFALQVQRQAVASSKSLLEEVKEMIRLGQREKVAAVRVDLQIAQSENEYIAAELAMEAAGQSLKDLMSATNDETVYYPDPNEFRSPPDVHPLPIVEALKLAKTKRSDYLGGKIAIERAKLSEKSTYSQTLPSLKLSSGYAYNGTDAKVGNALAEARDRKNPSSTIGLTFSYTLGNTDAAYSHKTAIIDRAKAESELSQIESRIQKEVTNASRALETAYRSMKISSLTRELAAVKQSQEYDKFRLGESTLRDVIDAQKELDAARIGEMKARITAYKAVSVYRVSIGELPLDLAAKK